MCPYCGASSGKIISLPAKTNLAPPVKYFVNEKTGEVRTPIHSNEAPDFGFKIEEAKGQSERLNLEKKLNSQQRIENEIKSDIAEIMMSATRSNRHADLRSKLGTMDNHSQQLVKAAMDRTNKKKYKRKQSSVIMNVNHFNSNNIKK